MCWLCIASVPFLCHFCDLFEMLLCSLWIGILSFSVIKNGGWLVGWLAAVGDYVVTGFQRRCNRIMEISRGCMQKCQRYVVTVTSADVNDVSFQVFHRKLLLLTTDRPKSSKI